jgi:hypothetical protein
LNKSWANLAEMEANNGMMELNVQPEVNLPISDGHEAAGPSNLKNKLPIVNMISIQAEAANPLVDEQGFQLVTSKATKKIVKKASTLTTSKQKPYITRAKVGSSKPFK